MAWIIAISRNMFSLSLSLSYLLKIFFAQVDLAYEFVPVRRWSYELSGRWVTRHAYLRDIFAYSRRRVIHLDRRLSFFLFFSFSFCVICHAKNSSQSRLCKYAENTHYVMAAAKSPVNYVFIDEPIAEITSNRNNLCMCILHAYVV